MLLQLTISVQSDEKKPLPSLPNFISPLARLNTCEVEVHVGGGLNIEWKLLQNDCRDCNQTQSRLPLI